ncbi:MAG: acetyltransferase [Lachnospiraceae bacterium]|nr:acetyltransferase [Lachnospiraceae bacterium]
MIIGASGHGKVVADIAKRLGVYSEISFLDDDLEKRIPGYHLMGNLKEYEKWKDTHEFIVAVGNCKIRSEIQKWIERNTKITVLVHPNAVLGENVVLGAGTVIMANAVINSASILGKGVIVNTGSTIDHDCRIGNYVHAAPGSHISGTVFIGDRVWVGVGSCIVNNVSICDECVIGAGATVIADIERKGTYVGVPAKRVVHGRRDAQTGIL